ATHCHGSHAGRSARRCPRPPLPLRSEPAPPRDARYRNAAGPGRAPPRGRDALPAPDTIRPRARGCREERLRARVGRSGPGAARRRAAAAGALFAAVLGGCTALELFQTRGARQQAAELAYLHGRVSTAFPSTHPLVVGVLRIDCAAGRALVAEIARAGPRGAGPLPPALQEQVAALRDHLQLVAHVVREQPGARYRRAAPGCSGVLASEDANEDGRYEDEPGLTAADPARFLEVAAGERVDVPDLVIPQDGRLAISDTDPAAEQVLGLVARSQEEQHLVSVQSVAVEGALADLADPRFGAENGRLGYFDPLGFGWRGGPRGYFLDDYHPRQ